MKSVNDMITRMNARLAKIEHDQDEHPGWLTRLMLADADGEREFRPTTREVWADVDRKRRDRVGKVHRDAS